MDKIIMIKVEQSKIMPTLLVRLIIARTIARKSSEDVSPRNESLTMSKFATPSSCNFLIVLIIS
jgi:hypothetical protein